MVIHAQNPSTQEAESGRFLKIWVSLGYTMKPYLNPNKENAPQNPSGLAIRTVLLWNAGLTHLADVRSMRSVLAGK